jgi:hypothetical protein
MVLVLLILSAQMPGHADGGILASSSIVINEFMALPQSSCTELDGEWIELYNNSDGWINLSGWTVTNSYGEEIVLSTYLLPPEGYFVMGACGDENLNGGFNPNQVYGGFELHETGTLTLFNASHSVADEVSYDAGWPVEPGASCERINPGWSSSSPSSWSPSTSVFGDGDKGTPGSQNSVYENSFAQNSWAFIKAFVQ